jgi:tetratricopeptide (TPR) repeat protein
MALYDLERYEEALSSFEEAIRLDGDNLLARLNHTQTLLVLGRWTEAFKALEELLPQSRDNSEDIAILTEIAIWRLIITNETHWATLASTLTTQYQQSGFGLVLGQVLTDTIADLISAPISPDARRLWVETWQACAGESAELRLPLRLLDAGVRYHDSGDPPDARILLELPLEERSILESLLGIGPD